MRKRILIIKLSAIGDVVMATPAIKVIRNANPDAHIAWLVERTSLDIVKGNPLLDEVIVWEKDEWKKLFRQGRLIRLISMAVSFIRDLRSKKFNVVYDLQGFLKSGIIAYLSGSRTRVGLNSKEGSRIFMTRVIAWDRTQKRIGAQYHQFVKALSLNPGNFTISVTTDERDDAFVEQIRTTHDIGRAYAVICPFSSKPQKQWTEDKWAAVAAHLNNAHHMPTLMLGGPGDVTGAARIASMSPHIINLAGTCTLKQSAALIKHSSLLIGGDTGLTHMASGFRIPTVALFGSTFPYNDTGGNNAVIIYDSIECSPCKRNPTCNGNFRCMDDITSERVIAAIKDVIVTL